MKRTPLMAAGTTALMVLALATGGVLLFAWEWQVPAELSVLRLVGGLLLALVAAVTGYVLARTFTGPR